MNNLPSYHPETYDLKECSCCGCESLVVTEDAEMKNLVQGKQEMVLRICMVCGNSKAVERIEENGFRVKRITHQISMEPMLLEIERTDKKTNSTNIKYKSGNKNITEEELVEKVQNRHSLLKALVLN